MILITWTKFKLFFWNNFENCKIFVNDIYSKVKYNFQYQLVGIQDLISQFKYLLFISFDFNAKIAL